MHLEKIVIGSSEASVAYAIANDCYHIQNIENYNLFWKPSKLSFYSELESWTLAKICLGVLSRNLDFHKVSKIKLRDNKITVTHSGGIFKATFDHCFIFERNNIIHDNKMLSHKNSLYRVIDDFTINNISSWTHLLGEVIFTKQDLVSELRFYNSLRVDGSKYYTDCVSCSYLAKEQLHDFEFSDTMALFKIRQLLNTMGVLGKKTGTLLNGKDRYAKPDIKHMTRDVMEIDRSVYANSEEVTFLSSDPTLS